MKKLLTASALATTLLLGSASAGAIINGTPDTADGWVGAMTGVDPGGTQRLCSGSLIDEGVFLTAGHCAVLTDVVLHFGDDIGGAHQTFDATAVHQHPQYSHTLSNPFDVGIVLFDQAGGVLPTGAIATENYVDSFSKQQLKDATFDTLGYGLVRNDANGNSSPLVPGTERLIASQTYLNDHNQVLTLSIHNNKGNGGGCFGDSGGPHLLNGVIVSVTSAGDGNCVATDATQRIDQAAIRNWILGFTS